MNEVKWTQERLAQEFDRVSCVLDWYDRAAGGVRVERHEDGVLLAMSLSRDTLVYPNVGSGVRGSIVMDQDHATQLANVLLTARFAAGLGASSGMYATVGGKGRGRCWVGTYRNLDGAHPRCAEVDEAFESDDALRAQHGYLMNRQLTLVEVQAGEGELCGVLLNRPQVLCLHNWLCRLLGRSIHKRAGATLAGMVRSGRVEVTR